MRNVVAALFALFLTVGSAQAATLSVTVTWINPPGGGAITAMHVQRSSDGGTTWENVSPAYTGNIQSFTEAGVPVSPTPTYRVNRCAGDVCTPSATWSPTLVPPAAATNVNGAYTLVP